MKRINVTANDIARGIPGQTDRCPIARAVARAFGYRLGWANAPRVETTHIWFPGDSRILYLDYDVAAWIKNYDQTERAEPIVLTVNDGTVEVLR